MTAFNARNIIPMVIGFLLCSCAWTAGNPKINNSTLVQTIHPGSTSMAAVEELLGPPDKKTGGAANEETWEYSQTRYFMIAPYWETQTEFIQILFSQGKVKDIKQGHVGHEGISLWPSAGER